MKDREMVEQQEGSIVIPDTQRKKKQKDTLRKIMNNLFAQRLGIHKIIYLDE